jgi:hypothetical protein
VADLAERVQRVRLLLDTLNDPYPTPRGALVPDAGPSPSRYVPCESCRSQGELRVRGGWQLCLLCDGLGWKRREREAPWDAYLELPLEEAAQLPQAIVPRAAVAVEPDAFTWERLRRRYDRHGSYGELRRQLDRLSLGHPARARLVRAVLVDHEPRQLDRRSQLDLDLGVVSIALRMRTVRVPAWLIERTTADRRIDTIAEMAAIGLSAGEIARRSGIPKGTVRKRLREIRGGRRLAGVRSPAFAG